MDAVDSTPDTPDSSASGPDAPDASTGPDSPAPALWQTVRDTLISPGSVVRMPRRAWLYFGLYLGACALLLGFVAWLLGKYEDDITALALGYVLPSSWHFAADLLIDHLLSEQHHLVIVNALVTASLMAVSLLLFPVKELVSASFETRGNLLGGLEIHEHPLWEQAWQEVKLLLLFVAVQGTIFWLGFLPHPAGKVAAVLLGVLFLWFSFAIDFIAPIFQRHLGHYSQIIKTLLRYAPAALLFGLLFNLPTILVGKLWGSNPHWSWGTALFLLFGVNVLCIAWAAASGTWLGSQLYPGFVRVRRSHPASRALTWLVVLAVLAGNGYLFGALGLSVHHKSQILKCDYGIDLDSFGFETPDLSALLDDELDVGMHVDLRIDNPTPFDVEIEPNEVIITHRGTRVGTVKLAPMRAPAGQKVTQTLRFTMRVTPSMITRGSELLDVDNWKMVLYIDVAPYFRLPIYLLGKPY